jgi:hypothetical protein
MRDAINRRRCGPTILGLVACVLFCAGAAAQEFQPFPQARITEGEWRSYLAEVQAKLGATEKRFPEEHLMVFEDRSRQMYFAFTLPGHPAHPAWVTRRVVDAGGDVDTEQIGYFAGDEREFAALYESYRDLTKRMRGEGQADAPPEAESREAREKIEELTQDYLVAHDAGDFEHAYAMLAPSMQSRVPYEEWRGLVAESLARFGKPQGHDVLKITWTRDPPDAGLPGTYAAVDLACHYEKLAVCNEVVIFHRGRDGAFRVLRHEQNTLDPDTLAKLCQRKERARIEFEGGAKIEITCPKRSTQ